MTTSAVTFLLDNLKQLALYHYDLFSGAEDELDLLNKDLNMMKAFLEDASTKGHSGATFKEWERQIKNMVYEVEDTIDSCVAQAASQKAGLSGKFSFKSISLKEKVRSVRVKKLEPLFAKRNELQIEKELPDTNADRTIANIRKPRKPENIVGVEDVTDTLIEYLTQPSEELEAISIIGMPGLGKTTVAWKIYHHQTIEYKFPKRIWVTISQEFDKKAVLLSILKEFTKHDMSKKREDELVKMVSQKLERAKFLLVLDDVWAPEVWDELKDSVLPMNNRESKVLLTSREERVATHANRKREPYALRFLNQEESWKLLQLEVGLKEYPRDLEQVGRRIAEQCDGLPLSIVVIGGILFDITVVKQMVGLLSKWEEVSVSVKEYVIKEDKYERMTGVISLSFKKLPYETRDCFLYLGMFPEDYDIPTWTLFQLWIGEGFISQYSEKNLEEIAEDYLMEFINRNLVMIGKTKSHGAIKTIRVHDAIGEFCKKQAEEKNHNVFQEIKKSRRGVFEPDVPEIKKYRRLCIHSHVQDFLNKKPKAPKARTFLCFSKSVITLQKNDIQLFTEIFDLLRVLDSRTIKFPSFPPKLRKLIMLRYITLSGDEIKLIPKTMSSLWNLRTLVVDTVQRELQVEVDIWEMRQLAHFKTKASIILKNLKGKGEGGEYLQTLTRLSTENCTEDVFGKAKNLTTLGVRGHLNTHLENSCFEKLQLLKKLKLENDTYTSSAADNPILERLPKPEKFPPKLKILTLSGTFLQWEHMSTLGKLSYLEVLKLKDNAFTGDTWNVEDGGFLKLEVLHIERADLVSWKASEGAESADPFPNLRIVMLNNCEKLEELPDSFGKSHVLQTLSMERVKKEAINSARRIEQAIKMMPEQLRGEWGGFKLLIAPGDE